MTDTKKIFIGYLITPEIRLHLNQSTKWKHAALLPILEEGELREIHYKSNNYIGIYLDSNAVTLHKIRATETFVKERFASYCSCPLKRAKLCIFAQVFVA